MFKATAGAKGGCRTDGILFIFFAAVLRLNSGDKERRLQGSSDVHPGATRSGRDPQRLWGWVACRSICYTGTEHREKEGEEKKIGERRDVGSGEGRGQA